MTALPFAEAARVALKDKQLRRNLGKATTHIRAKRAAVVAELDDWQELREAGRLIKGLAMRHLDVHLEQLEQSVTERGGTVHWARDAAEANAIVARLVKATGSDEAIKVKSLATDEIGLNDALAARGHPRDRDRPRRADRPARPERLAVAHPRARDPQEPRRDRGAVPRASATAPRT